MLIYAAVYAGFALAPGAWAVWPLLAAYGVYIAATEGVGEALVADHAPAALSGTAYGVFRALTGACSLVASVAAGVLWDVVSPAAPFWLGAGLAVTAAGAVALSARAARPLPNGPH